MDISVTAIPRSRGPGDAVLAEAARREVRDDALAPAADVAALDEARREGRREGDVDPLRTGHRRRVDRAVADRERAAASVDAVQRRAAHGDAVEHDVLAVAHLDPDLAAEHGHVADRDVVGLDPDAAADDCARVADERLRLVEDERPLVHAGREPHDRRLGDPGHAEDREERRGDGRREREPRAAQLSAFIRVVEPQDRQSRMDDDLRDEPRAGKEQQRPARAAPRCPSGARAASSARARVRRAGVRPSRAGRGEAGGRATRRARDRRRS